MSVPGATDLLDVNLLVSMSWPNHAQHHVARQWFSDRGERPWATTPITECGFVRVSSNRHAIPTAVSPAEALTLLTRIRELPGHVFLPDDLKAVLGPDLVDRDRVVGYRQVTDAHLLALARRHGARLATLERGAAVLAGPDTDHVAVVPTR